MKIYILSGPNLNLVGKREPEVYGSVSLDDYLAELTRDYAERADIHVLQSNSESVLIDKLHDIGYGEAAQAQPERPCGVILNAGALTHTSLALGDAVRAIPVPVLELHISNVYAREAFRQNSFIAPAAVGVITGLGLEGYRLAIDWFLSKAATKA